MSSPSHRMSDDRIPLIAAIVSGTAAAVMTGLAAVLLSSGI